MPDGYDQIGAFFNPSQPLVEMVEAQVNARNVSDDDSGLLLQRSPPQGQLFNRVKNAIKLRVNAVEALSGEVDQFVSQADKMPFPG